jgi:hypothetical protein
MLNGGIEDALGDAMIGIAQAPTWTPGARQSDRLDWKAVDRALRSIRRRRAALDAEEARWMREAERLEIWRPLGMVSMLDYLERVLGHAPRTAQDRLRVARALGGLPQLTSALTAGELSFSAVRELTRVATPATEASWLAAATDKTLRQIEELVADHRPGDRPEDLRRIATMSSAESVRRAITGSLGLGLASPWQLTVRESRRGRSSAAVRPSVSQTRPARRVGGLPQVAQPLRAIGRSRPGESNQAGPPGRYRRVRARTPWRAGSCRPGGTDGRGRRGTSGRRAAAIRR